MKYFVAVIGDFENCYRFKKGFLPGKQSLLALAQLHMSSKGKCVLIKKGSNWFQDFILKVCHLDTLFL